MGAGHTLTASSSCASLSRTPGAKPQGGREAGGVEVGGEGGRGSSVTVPTVVVAPLAVKAALAMVEAMVEKER